jgi:hypothetical protein
MWKDFEMMSLIPLPSWKSKGEREGAKIKDLNLINPPTFLGNKGGFIRSVIAGYLRERGDLANASLRGTQCRGNLILGLSE